MVGDWLIGVCSPTTANRGGDEDWNMNVDSLIPVGRLVVVYDEMNVAGVFRRGAGSVQNLAWTH